MSYLRIIYSLLLFVSLSIVSTTSVFAQDEISYFKGSFDKMASSADAEGKCYVVFFTKEHCAPCDKMKEETFTDPDVVQLMSEKTLIYEAEIPEMEALNLVEQFEVQAFPTLLVFSPKGVLIGKLIGGQSASNLTTFLERISLY